MEKSKASQGILTEDGRESGLEEMAAAFPPDRPFERDPIFLLAQNETRTGDSLIPANPAASDQPLLRTPAARSAEPAAPLGRLVPLPKLSGTELEELLSSLQLQLETEKGYRAATAAERNLFPPAPEGVAGLRVLAASKEESLGLLRFGFRRFLSQPAQLWVQGGTLRQGALLPNNEDVEGAAASVAPLVASMAEMKLQLAGEDLAFKIIQLSHIDVKGALLSLKGFGFTTLEDPSKIPSPVPFQQLPIIAAMPSPSEAQTALLGEKTLAKGTFDLSVSPSVATALPHEANTSPAAQLLVYFHAAHPEQFSRVRKALAEFVDRPDRQIFVEGMVLEISEQGLSDLGVEWQFKEGNFDAVVGTIAAAGSPTRTAALTFDDLKDFDKNWIVRLRALVEEGKAEILSRPTVLTLNNRQATIRVGTDIPIATSQEQGTASSANKIAFDFKYLATGISLNIRPRINETGDQISLMIDTIVSAAVPGADLELKSASGEVLAAAPTVSTRRVQTYARIRNNTPFIIGGLVSKDHSMLRDKVPVLGDIPYLGVLFRSQRKVTTKREVIIVLTPRVLEEDRANDLGPNLPKDEDLFDQFGNVLFRDSYRIRAEDVFDLSFLQENKPLQRIHRAAIKAMEEDYRLAEVYPFDLMADGRLPGEEVMIHRMMYEVIKRLSPTNSPAGLDRQIECERLILLTSQEQEGFKVEFLERILAGHGDGKHYNSFFAKNPGRALLIAFEGKTDNSLGAMLKQTHSPKISLISCADRQVWGETVWNLNRPGESGAARSAVVIHDPSDLVRLRRAVLLKKIVALNWGRDQMTRKNFGLGKVLLMPEAKPEQTHVIDAEAAEYFMQTEHYYAAALRRIEKAANDLAAALRQRGIAIPQD